MDGATSEWCVAADGHGRIRRVEIGGYDSWVMYGPVFFSRDFSSSITQYVNYYYEKPGTENYLWEQVLIEKIDDLPMYIHKQSIENVHEFESLEELRLFDRSYEIQTNNKAMSAISRILNITENDIKDIRSVKSGMTNQSFIFSADGQEYIFRLPGPGSELLIDRKNEKASYLAASKLNITDEVIFFDETSGVKIAKFYPDARNTLKSEPKDVRACMGVLRRLHDSGVSVRHFFDPEAEIDRYLKLCEGKNAIRFMDYLSTYEKMRELSTLYRAVDVKKTFCHVDSNPDNFIRISDEKVLLIDWEYAGMSDPLIDISMFSIYSYYTKPQLDWLLEEYLQREALESEALRVYVLAAMGGFLWALWTEYKQSFGVEFGDYGMRMYRYAKDYYKYAISMRGGEWNAP
jgi:thiamine kinase-like enzyme